MHQIAPNSGYILCCGGVGLQSHLPPAGLTEPAMLLVLGPQQKTAGCPSQRHTALQDLVKRSAYHKGPKKGLLGTHLLSRWLCHIIRSTTIIERPQLQSLSEGRNKARENIKPRWEAQKFCRLGNPWFVVLKDKLKHMKNVKSLSKTDANQVASNLVDRKELWGGVQNERLL